MDVFEEYMEERWQKVHQQEVIDALQEHVELLQKIIEIYKALEIKAQNKSMIGDLSSHLYDWWLGGNHERALKQFIAEADKII